MSDGKVKPLRFRYRNYKGKVSDRKVLPVDMIYTTSKYHGDERQWFMDAWDVDKGARRMFAVKDILEYLDDDSTVTSTDT